MITRKDSGISAAGGIFEISKKNFEKVLTDTGENGTNLPVYFRLGTESYSSLGRVGKK